MLPDARGSNQLDLDHLLYGKTIITSHQSSISIILGIYLSNSEAKLVVLLKNLYLIIFLYLCL